MFPFWVTLLIFSCLVECSMLPDQPDAFWESRAESSGMLPNYFHSILFYLPLSSSLGLLIFLSFFEYFGWQSYLVKSLDNIRHCNLIEAPEEKEQLHIFSHCGSAKGNRAETTLDLDSLYSTLTNREPLLSLRQEDNNRK